MTWVPYLWQLELSFEVHAHQLITSECAYCNIASLFVSVTQSVRLGSITYSFGGLQDHQIALSHMPR